MFFSERTGLQKLLLLKVAAGGSVVEDTATGNPLTFFTDLARPLKSLLIPFTPKQTGSGDPSPDNVRPITGWTGVTVEHGGSNLLLTAEITFGKWINESGATNNDSRGAITSKINVESSTDYTLSYNGERPLSFAVVEYNASDVFIKRNYIDTDQTATDEISFSTSANTKAVICEIYTRDGDMTEAVLDSMKWQFEKGSTKTQYDDTAIAYPVTWSSEGTVYGGYVDLVTGEVWSTWTGIDKKWSQGAISTILGDNTRKRFEVSILPTKAQSALSNERMCNIAQWSPEYSTDSVHYYVYQSGNAGDKSYAYVFMPNDTDGDTKIQVAIMYIEPVIVTTLTPQQITALVGNNTIWSDANGDMTAIYYKKG